MLKRLREPVNGLTHFFAAVTTAAGLAALLVLGRGDIPKEVSLLIYGSSLVIMFSASAGYHLVRCGPQVAQFLRTLDHSSIYLLIAGTYTPICLHFFTGFWQWGMLTLIWSMACVGIAVKLFILNAPRWITAAIYLLMGWLSLLAIQEMLSTMPIEALIWLVLGGLWFAMGAVIYVTKRPDWYPGIFGFHELWHVFVILGCFSHFIVIAAFVAPQVAVL